MSLEERLKEKLLDIDFKHERPPIEGELGFELTEPCASCPFRSDKEPYYFQLIDYELVGIAEGDHGFSCHETDPRSDFKGAIRPGGVQHCAGAARFVMNCGTWNPYMTKAYFDKPRRFDPDALSERLPVFKSLTHLLSAYTEALRRGKRNKYFPETEKVMESL